MSAAGTDSRDVVISLREVHKYYGDGDARLHVLKGIDLEIDRGEFVSIMGSSGSGKSTLLNLLGCLDRATNGEYRLEGEDVSRLSDDRLSTIRNERLGFVFQSFQLIPQLDVLENVEVPLLYGKGLARRRREHCRDLLAAVGLGHRLHHRPAQLSGGERQRVAIARALVNDPVLLLADEPTGNLDTATGEEVLALIEALNREGRTVMVITHDPEVAARAHRQIHIRDGLIVEEQRSSC
ncbi:MAG: ABC transporter ATP-binding protein [Planctomycetota bacterium]